MFGKKMSLYLAVGTPYKADLPLLRHFDTVVLRDKSDLSDVNRLVIGKSTKVFTFPDIGFVLPRIFIERADAQYSLRAAFPKKTLIGISIPRTFYGKNEYVYDYIDFMVSLCKALRHIRQEDMLFVLLPFCHKNNKIDEDDRIINEQIHELLGDSVDAVDAYEFWRQSDHLRYEYSYTEYVFHTVGHLDLLLCGRFHAHIFAIAQHTPFLSLSCSRKCYKLMSELGLSDSMIQLETNNADKPRRFSRVTDVVNMAKDILEKRDAFATRLKHLYDERIRPEVDTFVQFYIRFLKERVRERENESADIDQPIS